MSWAKRRRRPAARPALFDEGNTGFVRGHRPRWCASFGWDALVWEDPFRKGCGSDPGICHRASSGNGKAGAGFATKVAVRFRARRAARARAAPAISVRVVRILDTILRRPHSVQMVRPSLGILRQRTRCARCREAERTRRHRKLLRACLLRSWSAPSPKAAIVSLMARSWEHTGSAALRQ